MSAKSLAYWIMSDSLISQYGLTICTDSFTIAENVTLINILKIKFNLDCNMHYYRNYPRIYIKASSMRQLKKIVDPYIIPFSRYKLEKG